MLRWVQINCSLGTCSKSTNLRGFLNLFWFSAVNVKSFKVQQHCALWSSGCGTNFGTWTVKCSAALLRFYHWMTLVVTRGGTMVFHFAFPFNFHNGFLRTASLHLWKYVIFSVSSQNSVSSTTFQREFSQRCNTTVTGGVGGLAV